MNNSSLRPLRVHSHYPAAAILASLILGLLELAPHWVAGPARAELYNAVGQLARYVASLTTPAPSLLRAGSDRAEMAYRLFLGGEALLIGAFIALLWWRIRPSPGRTPLAGALLLGAQLVLAVMLNSLAFHLILSMELAALLTLRRALVWLAVQVLLGAGMDLWVLTSASLHLNDQRIHTTLAVLTSERFVQVLGFAFVYLMRQEQRIRVQLAASNAQLRATQSLLADTVRSAERMRIARDLHDAVGHHLTALNLHLDLAVRQADVKPSAPLSTARELAKSLLSEVRGVVSAERQQGDINVRQALRLLCGGIPSPAIELTMDSGVDACPAAAAHTLLCCVQEAITNTMRHAQAALLTIDIRYQGGGVLARIADDGQGSKGAPEGNGLAGMRERLAEHGGSLSTGSGPGANTGAGSGSGSGSGADSRSTARPGHWLEFSLPFAGARA
jgi:signal transduction histidine kinase